MGGLYASGLTLSQIEELSRQFGWRNRAGFCFSRLGLESNARMEDLLRAHMPVTRFEELKIPFAVMVTDLGQGMPIVLRDTGDVPFAIRATACLPALYVPCRDEQGRMLVDGGLVANVPISYARDLGADIIIAVDVGADGAPFMEPPRTALGALPQPFPAVARLISNPPRAKADL